MRALVASMLAGLLVVPCTAGAQASGDSSAPPSTDSGPPTASTDSPAPASHATPDTQDGQRSPPPEQAPTTQVAQAPPPSETPTYANGSQPVNSQHPADDDGRSIDLLFIQVEGGYSYIDLTGLSTSTNPLVPSLATTKASGYGYGLTAGFRSWIFAVAAHAYLSQFDAGTGDGTGYQLGELMVMGQLRLPVPVVEPYIEVGIGYAWLGTINVNTMYAASTSSINGYVGMAGAGLDVWLGRYITIGAGFDFAVMNLRRGGVTRSGSSCSSSDPTCVELSMDGDAVGTLLTLHAQAGLHF